MSDKPSNYEFDEELLSAYLDGELSDDERAAVEARLASDPGAQQLLHELRSVSQSIQALPTESLGRDLGEEILRRARDARPVLVVRGSPDPAQASDHRSPGSSERETFGPAASEVGRPAPNSPHLGNTMPTIRIFNSPRAWIWASMAVAAGLLLMIFQSGDEPANKLPAVAARDKEAAKVQPADESGRAVAPESRSPSPATVAFDGAVHEKVDELGAPMSAAAPAPREPAGRSLSESIRDGAVAGPPIAGASPALKARNEEAKTVLETGGALSTSTAQPTQLAADKPAAATEPTGRVGGAGGALGFAAEKQKSESTVSPKPQRYFVVHVVANPDALKDGSFERLLADNQIEFVPQPAKNQPLAFGGGKLAKPAQSETASNEPSNKTAEIHPAETEMVLVEAPAPAIESCLADLNKNSNDFLSIAVNEVPQSHDRFDAKSTASKKLAENRTNLTRFSRGTAPVAQKDTSGLHDFYKYDFKKLTEPVANGLPRARSYGAEAVAISGLEPEANGSKPLGDKSPPAPDIRRARRIETLAIPNRQSGEVAAATGLTARTQSGADLAKQPMSQQKPDGSAEPKADTNGEDLKVLFVFTPAETPASSAPPDNRPK